MRILVIIVSIVVYCGNSCAMDFFDPRKGTAFAIIALDGKRVPVSYENAVQIKVLHPLDSVQQFISQHNGDQIGLFIQGLDAIKAGALGAYLSGVSGGNTVVGIDERLSTSKNSLDVSGEEKVGCFLKCLCENDAIKDKKNLRALLSVAHELRATEFAMICMSHLINHNDQKRLFSVMVPSKNWSVLEKILDAYIVENSAIEKKRKRLDDHDNLLLASEGRGGVVSPCSKKSIRVAGGKIEIYNVDDKSSLLTLKTGRASIQCTSFSRDGNKLACIGDGSLLVWNVHDGTLLNRYEVGSSLYVHMGLNKDASKIVVAKRYVTMPMTYANDILVLDMQQDGKSELLYSLDNMTDHCVISLYIRDDNKVGFYDDQQGGNRHCLWNLNAGKEMISRLNFAQLVLLYQLHELSTLQQSSLPVMTGFVQDYVSNSLPEILAGWAVGKFRAIRDCVQ